MDALQKSIRDKESLRFVHCLCHRDATVRSQAFDVLTQTIDAWIGGYGSPHVGKAFEMQLGENLVDFLRLSYQCPFDDIREKSACLLTNLQEKGLLQTPHVTGNGPSRFIPENEMVQRHETSNIASTSGEHLLPTGDDGTSNVFHPADGDHQCCESLPCCSHSQCTEITKGQIIEWHNRIGLMETAQLVRNNSDATDKGIQYSITNCVKKFRQLNKSRSKTGGEITIQTFLEEKFEPPKRRVSDSKSSKPKESNYMVDVYKNVVQDLNEELMHKTKNNEELKSYTIELEHNVKNIDILHRRDVKKIIGLESKVEKHSQRMSNLKKENKEHITHLKSELKEAVLQNEKLQQRNCALETKLSEKRKELKRTAAREKYANEKLVKVEQKLDNELKTVEIMQTEMDENRENVMKVTERIEELEYENENLNETVIEMCSKVVQTYDNNRKMFTPDLQCCVYSLLQNHVGTSHVSSVIENVLNMVGMEANRLPSRSTINNMNIQRLIISQKQLSETLPEKENTCLYTDETSKKGDKYGGFHLSDSDGTMYVLGLRSLPTKSAADTLAAFHEILLDIDQAASTGNFEGRAILTHLKNTMSDRAATEVKFNKLLEDFRKHFLPAVIDNYETLNDLEKASVDRLYNFFCGLHPLINMADAVDATLAEVEKEYLQEPLTTHVSSDKSATANFIRAAAKIVARGADDKSGCYGQFRIFIQDFLKENNFHSIPVEPYRGNRFNIIFSNAAGLYFIHNKLQDFLKFIDKKNKLLSSVKADLQRPFFRASLKALGLICYIVTAPLWCLLESKNVHILDMNLHYLTFVNFLKDAALNIDAFMSGELTPFAEETIISRDPIYFSLLKVNSEIDPHVVVILSIIFPALHQLCQRLYKDHLPGGRYSDLTSEMKQATKAVQKHNRFAEMVFGYLDFLLKFKPNIRSLAAEAYLMFSQNKTKEWLDGKTQQERNQIVSEARKEVSDVRVKFKQRQTEIIEKKRKILEENQRRTNEEQEKKLKEMEILTNKIITCGFCESEQDVDDKLSTFRTVSEKKKFLKLQLTYRQKVLRQIHENQNIYRFSKKTESGKRKELSVEDLTHNLKKLVQREARN